MQKKKEKLKAENLRIHLSQKRASQKTLLSEEIHG